MTMTQHAGFTLTDAGTVVLGKTTYRVEVQHIESTDNTVTWLHGPRGASYTLDRRVLTNGVDTGVRQVISFKSGQPLRVGGNEVRVVQIGNIIEVSK